MKTAGIFFFIPILFSACKKDAITNQVNDFSNDQSTNSTGPVKTPKVIMASTTKTQFIANADGNGTADFTLSFAAKKSGISIVSFTFLAYESDSSDALSIFAQGVPGFFSPTSYYAPAKAIAFNTYMPGNPDALTISLPNDGSPVPVTFTIHYNIPSAKAMLKAAIRFL